MRIINKLLKDNKGFTLVELIVVIAVLGILSGIAVPRLTGVQDKARYASGRALLANIKTPLELYRVENGGYPTGDNTSYDNLGNELNSYIDNFDSMLPETSSSEWSFDDYTSSDGTTYTLVINHPDLDQDLEMTPDGITKINDTD